MVVLDSICLPNKGFQHGPFLPRFWSSLPPIPRSHPAAEKAESRAQARATRATANPGSDAGPSRHHRAGGPLGRRTGSRHLSAAIRDFDFNKANLAPRILDRAGNPASNVIPALDTSRIRIDAIGPVVTSYGDFVTRGQQVSVQVTAPADRRRVAACTTAPRRVVSAAVRPARARVRMSVPTCSSAKGAFAASPCLSGSGAP